ncbi:MAG: hypothetical protein HZB51_20465 [Chloroflexi bacterium]|nr:hypothetical protein [Chloroflexota bacterium]
MKQRVLMIAALVFVCAVLGLPTPVYASGPAAAPVNQITLDITVNDRGELSIGGFSMTQLGLGRLDDQARAIVKDLDTARLVVQGELVTADVHGTPLLKIQWTPTSRQTLATLASRYGVQMSPDLQTRIEEWVSSSNIDVTARYSNEASKPLVAKIPKPILVDLGPQGEITVEKVLLANPIDPGVYQTIKQSQVQNATLCWNKGTLNTQADGKDLPSITLYPDGMKFLNQALNLNIDNNSLNTLFSVQVGSDISMPSGVHPAGFACKFD